MTSSCCLYYTAHRHPPEIEAACRVQLDKARGDIPLVAVGLVHVLGFGPDVSSLLIVAAGLPVAVNVYILSAQYQQDEELASQAVFWTTLLSGVTISILLALAR